MSARGPGTAGSEELPGWLHTHRLARVWAVVGTSLERRGLEARGSVRLHDLDRDERHALSDVLGRPLAGDSVRLSLPDLAERLRSRTGLDLAAVVSSIIGRPLTDHAARRHEDAVRRDAPFLAARAWLASAGESRGSGPAAWVEGWLDGLRHDGILTQVRDATSLIRTALVVLDERGALWADGPPHVSRSAATGRRRAGTSEPRWPADGTTAGSALRVVARTELAARVTGSAHGLDDDTKESLVVLRAAAARLGAGLPRRAADRRALWESLGIVVDRVSTTCLTWNLLPDNGSGTTERDRRAVAREVAGGGTPRHVTWWDLDAGLEWAPGQSVLVCENPRTLEAVAVAMADRRLAVVCTMGRANLVVREVLARLVRASAVLHYHGDFDWAGLALANECLTEFGAVPWLMTVDDYTSGHGSLSLPGTPVEARWDPELATAMRARGLAVHEEAVLDSLLGRLSELLPGDPGPG